MQRLTSLDQVQFVNVAQISKHLECSICSSFFCHPHRLYCGHTFCSECLSGLKKSVANNQSFNCPLCRQAVDMRYISEDLVAKRLLEEQQYCLWKGPLSDLGNHLDFCSFKEHDAMSSNLIMQYDKDIKQQTMKSELNTVVSNQTFIFSYILWYEAQSTMTNLNLNNYYLKFIQDEKLQENINKNVGENLLVRLLNKNKNMAQEMAKQLSTKEDSRSSIFTTKKSIDEKSFINNSFETNDNDEQYEYINKEKLDQGVDEVDELLQMFSDDQKSETKENSQQDQIKQQQQEQKEKEEGIQKVKKRQKQKKEKIVEDEEYIPTQINNIGRRRNKKRQNVGDALADIDIQTQLLLYQELGIDIDQLF